MTYAKQLLEFRAKHNLTQKDLAAVLGTSKSVIYYYEANMHKPTPKNRIIFENKMKEWEENKNVSL